MHPQSDAMVERFNQTLENHLAKVEEHQKDWYHYIPLFLISYRSALRDSTNVTPAKVIFGREVRLSLDVQSPVSDHKSDLEERLDAAYKMVHEDRLRAGEQIKSRYDWGAKGSGFNEGLVLLQYSLRRKDKSPKLQASWEGP